MDSKFEFECIQTFSSLEKFDFQSIPRWLTWYIYVVARRWSILRIPLWISRPKPWPRWIIWHFLKLTELLPMRVKQHQFSWSTNGKERDAHRMWLCLRFWHVGFKAVWSSLILPPRCLAVCVAPCLSCFFALFGLFCLLQNSSVHQIYICMNCQNRAEWDVNVQVCLWESTSQTFPNWKEFECICRK